MDEKQTFAREGVIHKHILSNMLRNHCSLQFAEVEVKIDKMEKSKESLL